MRHPGKTVCRHGGGAPQQEETSAGAGWAEAMMVGLCSPDKSLMTGLRVGPLVGQMAAVKAIDQVCDRISTETGTPGHAVIAELHGTLLLHVKPLPQTGLNLSSQKAVPQHRSSCGCC